MKKPKTLSEASAGRAREPDQTVQAESALTLTEQAKFPLSTLRKDCVRLFGVSTSTFDGATFHTAGEYTINEIREMISAWKKEVVCK